MTSVLDSIIQGVKADLEVRKSSVSLGALKALVDEVPRALPAAELLHKNSFSVISEVKRASPSKGHLSDIPDPASLALEYQTGGAQVISVLTEERKFSGSLADLDAVRSKVSIPILRKDFISTEYQLLEARAFGADFALLIVAGLPNQRLLELKNFAEQLELEVLVETHSEDEVRFAVDIGAKLIGVNARDLSTFETDRNLFAKVAVLIPDSSLRIAESAVRNAADVREYRDAGADVVLVGEALVKSSNPELAMRELLGEDRIGS